MKKHFENEPENILQTYSTAGGIKRKYWKNKLDNIYHKKIN
jgi:hypothetical protein